MAIMTNNVFVATSELQAANFRRDASICIARLSYTATCLHGWLGGWVAGWLAGWLSVTAGIVSKRLNLS